MRITKQELANKGFDLSDFALLISEGNDYDDICQSAITRIAEELGAEEDSDDYDTIVDWVNETIMAE